MKVSIIPALSAALCLCASSTPAFSQNATRANIEPGYEDLAAAAQLAQSNRALAIAEEPGATLEKKRAAVSDRDMLRALDLLHSWLEMPALPLPAPDPDASVIFPKLYSVISLGTLLAVRNYVLLADGHVGEAIELARDGLRLSYAIGSHSTTAWLCGVVIVDKLVNSLMPHLDQFSALDCEHLLRLAREWMSSYDALPTALDRARTAKMMLLSKSSQPDKIQEIIQAVFQSTNGAAIAAQMQTLSAQEMQHMMERSAAVMDAAYVDAQLALSTPYWQRRPGAGRLPTTGKPEDPLVSQIVSMSMPDFSKSLVRYTQIQATAHLVGCHAAIRRYRWEHDALPASLAELKLGSLAIDPFTGKQIAYKVEGSSYKISVKAPAGQPMSD